LSSDLINHDEQVQRFTVWKWNISKQPNAGIALGNCKKYEYTDMIQHVEMLRHDKISLR